MSDKLRVAAAHLAPVFLDREASVAKACDAIAEAARHGAGLIAFPESYIPAFPLWSALQAPIRCHDYFIAMADQSMRVDGPEMARVREAARRAGVLVSLGFSESTTVSVGCLWNSNVLIGADGQLLNHHRKLMPTFYEKLTWAPGDGAGLRVVATAAGRVGALICGENTNPLARYALMAQGEQVHLSSYPPAWPTRDPAEAQRYDLADAIRIRAAAHAFEAKCFNVVASGFVDKATMETLSRVSTEAVRILRDSPRSVSMVVDPMGRVCTGPVCETEELLYADVDLNDCVEPKQFHDVVGGYNRFDVFRLSVNRSRQQPVYFQDEALGHDRDGDAIPTEEAKAKDDPR